MSPSHQDPIQPPGTESELTPKADHGETSYRGAEKLVGRVAVITGGDSGIGRAVAIAYAREGADVLVSYLSRQEDEDARETARHVEAAGRRCILVPGDIANPEHCRAIVARAVQEFGRIDILVNNAAFQRTYDSIENIPDEEWEYTFRTNISAMFYLAKAAVPHMKPGSSIINTTSIQSDKPTPMLLAYASTKGAISNFTAGLAQMLGSKGIRVNGVAPGPIWTPLIPSTMPPEKVASFGKDTPLGRPGQPRELAGIYVLLACDEGSYMSGGIYTVTGGLPFL
ncbi:SDR family oxidoreductase [Salinarimonas soli]|uniref:SDR family oxidoreductase n=1 Tax=Salinarimonas soli TaxID=1638099 RepID=A0A5B2VR73_9HYPH|nr:SDR family oxidoreductase [Salinarimonas soli]KAA2241168.1 SDR family oxidoreductase [Salinarimonas soli]